MPEDDPDVFSHFAIWLYSGNILGSHEDIEDIDWTVLTNLYLFGEARGIYILQNAAIDLCIDKFDGGDVIPTSEIYHVYENTAEDSPFRRLCVDWFTFEVTLRREWFRDDGNEHFPKDFLFDLAVSFYEKGAGEKSEIIDIKNMGFSYHVNSPPSSPIQSGW